MNHHQNLSPEVKQLRRAHGPISCAEIYLASRVLPAFEQDSNSPDAWASLYQVLVWLEQDVTELYAMIEAHKEPQAAHDGAPPHAGR